MQERDYQIADRRRFREANRHNGHIVTDGVQHRTELDRAEHKEDGHDAECKTEIAHTVGNEGLDGGVVRRLVLVPEPDQQIRGEPHALPAEEELDKIVRRDQHEHHEGEE